ncbi:MULTISPECIES: hypothetical protein [Mycolicibacter]|uniref:Uncharacterized protein n=2 Tax=Mycolicibacter TaxID=1073531 RepID=A0ABU5XL56_9MYCO|nr:MULTISPECIES: hypothetical protein [unclassified Mycolicibacter]MEB3023010.1 hypothetical protein [Mycolicibacter sp. MYC098]MEB3033520.1 hypothetical protein [Mycolicibacter sp. MYC340]
MFERWVSDRSHPTLFPVDRSVAVYASEALPCSLRRRANDLPLWVKSFGLRIEAHMPGRQVAWLRRSDGGWIAVVLVEALSANRQSRVTMPLWLDPQLLTTDLSVIQQYEYPRA